MSWLVLIVSGMLEAVWATALSASRGLSRPGPAVLFVVSLAASMLGLAWAMTDIATGTAYAVWVGVGATLTIGWSMVTGAEPATRTRVALLVLLVGCVAGLKAVA